MMPVFWKSKQIARSVHLSKDAETLNLAKLVDDSVFLARQLEILLFGSYSKSISVKLYTDSEPTLESIASTRPVETKRLRNQVQELKDVLIDKEIECYGWLSSKDMIADMLTKEMKMNDDIGELLLNNNFHIKNPEVNLVKAIDDELKMFNIRNRKVESTELAKEEAGGMIDEK